MIQALPKAQRIIYNAPFQSLFAVYVEGLSVWVYVYVFVCVCVSVCNPF